MSKQAVTDFKSVKGEGFEAILNGVRAKVGPTHSEMVDILKYLGPIFGFFHVEVEGPSRDRIYKCDVTWREHTGHPPIQISEVELHENIDKALSRLTHVYDYYYCELYLMVLDEKYGSGLGNW